MRHGWLCVEECRADEPTLRRYENWLTHTQTRDNKQTLQRQGSFSYHTNNSRSASRECIVDDDYFFCSATCRAFLSGKIVDARVIKSLYTYSYKDFLFLSVCVWKCVCVLCWNRNDLRWNESLSAQNVQSRRCDVFTLGCSTGTRVRAHFEIVKRLLQWKTFFSSSEWCVKWVKKTEEKKIKCTRKNETLE